MKAHELTQLSAVTDVLAERHAQDLKWGEQNHDPLKWLAILTEHSGKLAEAIVHKIGSGTKAKNIRLEAVRTAAVALAMVECIDRYDAAVEKRKI